MNEETNLKLIDKQLIAYNNKDIDLFLQCWDKNAKIYLHPNTLLADGIEQIKERHLIRFQEPDLFATLISRTQYNGKIVDQELVTRNFPEGKGTIEVLAIYEIANEKIYNAWFLISEPRFQ
ncbi:steroid delta-isomerase [Leptospira sp. 2 VSF19]|uniref:Steroid delta-isomerase n=1 Tax=Leptospira soteropolitanensis TaxID=2950025 RepID=A0AAW5VBZ7_9LEPT|nr:steroid delta-isomerase [Leptospira soteropolitanensis]MCW7491591.1 steroid delta-isomerase [Leptospira soteropolitanensis]MCW7499175.1 steroid delta-isomerase [Leptospira soteropolitanensis]MCW7521233.1 steroid delta-isomerase [Leptospira soteropolitanensis]MCW7525279.1 steroid delta-isomerase [Leptospira soteropolitanensis]MCW7529146.1 steroid delta-isomerase [Leptospira soteropolitanensis]